MPKVDLDKPQYAYWAYGSNLSCAQMDFRCPSNLPMTAHTRQGFRLEFRGNGVANVRHTGAETDETPGAIYLVSARDLYALDMFEGVNRADMKAGKYRRLKFEHPTYGTVYYYRMNRGYAMRPPALHYLARIRRGYSQWRLPDLSLNNAVSVAEQYTANIFASRKSSSVGTSWFDGTDPAFDFGPFYDNTVTQTPVTDRDYWNNLTDGFVRAPAHIRNERNKANGNGKGNGRMAGSHIISKTGQADAPGNTRENSGNAASPTGPETVAGDERENPSSSSETEFVTGRE